MSANEMSHEWCEVVSQDRQGHSRDHVEEGCERTQYKNVLTAYSTDRVRDAPQTHHDAAQLSTARVGVLRPMPYCLGIGSTTGGSRQDTHGTPALTTVRRPWVAQPHEHARAKRTRHAVQNTNGAEHRGRVATKEPGSGIQALVIQTWPDTCT